MDVLCHGTKVGETFGNTIAEAMMHGKPVVSHRGFNNWTQAQPEVLGELAPILYIDSHDVIKYANIMKRLKDDKLFYNDVSNKSIKRANAIFDYRIVARKYLDVYQRVHNGNL
jgi:glycosyltransferase involved in cell wall biosynthesis